MRVTLPSREEKGNSLPLMSSADNPKKGEDDIARVVENLAERKKERSEAALNMQLRQVPLT